MYAASGSWAGNLMIQELVEHGRQNTRGEEGERLEENRLQEVQDKRTDPDM